MVTSTKSETQEWNFCFKHSSPPFMPHLACHFFLTSCPTSAFRLGDTSYCLQRPIPVGNHLTNHSAHPKETSALINPYPTAGCVFFFLTNKVVLNKCKRRVVPKLQSYMGHYSTPLTQIMGHYSYHCTTVMGNHFFYCHQ